MLNLLFFKIRWDYFLTPFMENVGQFEDSFIENKLKQFSFDSLVGQLIISLCLSSNQEQV